MTETANLGLPFIDGSQAQKHITHNEALRILDDAIQIAVLDTTLTVPPPSPVDGERHIVASGATGAWAGQDDAVATWETNAWRFLAPKAGWCVWSIAGDALLVFDGDDWISVTAAGGTPLSPDEVPHLGINTPAVETNLLTVRSNDVLFHAIDADDDGTGDVRLQLSKETEESTASVVFSDAFSGHAEFGLTGDNDFHLKVSADGMTWRDALTFDNATGRVAFPSGGAREMLSANRTYYVRIDGSDSNDGLNNSSGGAFLTVQKAIDTVAMLDIGIYDVTIQLADGTYTTGAVVNGPWVGTGNVRLQGNVTTPANTVISTSGASCVVVQNYGRLIVGALKLQNSGGSGDCIQALFGGAVLCEAGLIFGNSARYHYECETGGIIQNFTNYSIVGGAVAHAAAGPFGVMRIAINTITITGTLSFTYFVGVSRGAVIDFFGMTFAGSYTVTGKRYDVSAGGILFVAGSGANFLPGNAAGSGGTTSGGGFYG